MTNHRQPAAISIPSLAPGSANSEIAIESGELVRRALAGCEDAFNGLAVRYAPRLIQLLERRHGGNRADAEDVVQEALFRAFQRLAYYDSKYPFRTWLYTIAFRVSTDHLRRRRRVSQFVSLDTLEPVANEQSPESVCEHRELAENIWAIARRVLSEPQYVALWLHVGEQLSSNEVASVMGKNAIATRVTIYRAKRSLLPHVARLSNLEDDSHVDSKCAESQS